MRRKLHGGANDAPRRTRVPLVSHPRMRRHRAAPVADLPSLLAKAVRRIDRAGPVVDVRRLGGGVAMAQINSHTYPPGCYNCKCRRSKVGHSATLRLTGWPRRAPAEGKGSPPRGRVTGFFAPSLSRWFFRGTRPGSLAARSCMQPVAAFAASLDFGVPHERLCGPWRPSEGPPGS